MPTTDTLHARWMVRADMPEVEEIERLSFERGVWAEEDFTRVLYRRDVIPRVVEAGGRIAGYVLYQLLPRRIEILNLAVHPDRRRAGVGAWMVGQLRAKLAPGCRRSLTVNVRESNLAAQLFFRAAGLRAIQVVRGFYEDSGEDAYRMGLTVC